MHYMNEGIVRAARPNPHVGGTHEWHRHEAETEAILDDIRRSDVRIVLTVFGVALVVALAIGTMLCFGFMSPVS
jgi:hypothetical protein